MKDTQNVDLRTMKPGGMTSRSVSPAQLVFFLGGYDLEMVTIRDLLAQESRPCHDRGLSWGARASDYRTEIEAVLAQEQVPVLVELANDLSLDLAQVILVDHHGAYAGEDRPTSLHQVFELLALPPERWTRWFELVAVNDWGYVPALVAMGASQEEIIKVRAADRAAQGITAAEEAAGEQAAASAKSMVHGKLTIVQLPHARTATVTDRLAPELGGPGYENLVVYSPEEVNFFGTGELVYALDEAFPGGWYGGALPERGFWGHGEPVPEVLPVLLEHLRKAEAAEIASIGSQAPTLFEQLTALPTLVRAFDRVEENHGAPGVDRETIEEFGASLEPNLQGLQRELLTGQYRPRPLLRVYVDKEDGTQRSLSIPTVRDRVVQTAAALVLTPVLDREFEDVSYAYRPGRSVDQAVQRILALRDRGYHWVLDADIQRYFDEIPHDKLFACLRQYVQDERVLALVQQWLTVEVQDQGERQRLDKGVPQGSPLSPLFANLYLDRFDEAHIEHGHKLVRFADDFVILCKNRPKAEAALELSEAILQELQLSLHPRKTRITNFAQGFRYLGVQFLRSMAFRPKYPEELPDMSPPVHAALVRPSISSGAVTETPESIPASPAGSRPETTMVRALRDALGELPPEETERMWEDLCNVAAEADLPPPTEGHDPYLRSLYLMQQGAVLAKEDERFVIRKNGVILSKVPALKVDQILVFGNIQITTPAMQFCLREDIPIFLLSSRGRYYGVIESLATDKVLLHRDQFARVTEPNFVLQVSREIVRGKVANTRTLLLRAARKGASDAVHEATTMLQSILNSVECASSVETLRGLEGAAAAQYFAVWPEFVGKEWHFEGRKRRPPPDPVNSLLSFGYTLLFYNTYALVRAQGLHPHVGFYHELRPGHPALISDLMEEFRAPIVDATVLALLHRKQVQPDDFRMPPEAGMPCLMKEEARRKVTRAFEAVFNRPVTHPDAGDHCDYRRAIALQAQRLVAVIKGEQPVYKPFLRR
jgi:CRISPR-associated protein Cas1